MSGSGFVGRSAERDELRGALDALPRSSVVLVEGEPGVGKTALLDVVAHDAARRGLRVHRCLGDDLGSSRPYGAVADQLVPASHLEGRAGRPIDLIGHLVGPVGGPTPVLLIDDLQWADPASLDVLVPLVRALVQLGSVVVAAYRSGSESVEFLDAIDRLGRLAPVHLTLGALDDADAVELARQQLGRPLGHRLEQLVSRAGGNPLYVSTLVASLHEEGQLVERGGGIEVDGSRSPRSFQSLVLRRVALLGDDGRSVLRSAAIFGRNVPLDLLVELSDLPSPRVLHAVSAAADAGLLDSDGDDTIVFRHDLVREAVYGDIVAPVRQQLHRRAMTLLRRGHPPGALVPHLVRLELAPDDVDLVIETAPFGSATAFLDLAERARLVATAQQRITLDLQRLDALVWCGRLDEVVEATTSLLADASIDDSTALPIRVVRIRALHHIGRARDAVRTHQPLPRDAEPGLRAAEAAELALGAGYAREYELAREVAAIALSLGDDPEVHAKAEHALAWSAYGTGRIAEAHEHLVNVFALHSRMPVSSHRFGPHLTEAYIHQMTGRHDDAVRAAARDEHDADLTLLARTPYRHLLHAMVALDAGRWSDAVDALASGLTYCHDHHVPTSLPALTAVLDLISLYQTGAVADADAPRVRPQPGLAFQWLVLRDAVAAELTGDPVRAIDILSTVVDDASGYRDRPGLAVCGPRLARLAVEHGRRSLATEVVHAVATWPRDEDDPAARTVCGWVEAIVAGDIDRLVGLAGALGDDRPVDAAMLLDDAARLAALDGTPRIAAEHARSAIDRYGSLGAAALERSLRDHLGSRGVDLRTGSRSTRATYGWDAVTPAEQRVLAALADGSSNAEIADLLGVSRRTVESHLRSVYRKVGLSSRFELLRELMTRTGAADPRPGVDPVPR